MYLEREIERQGKTICNEKEGERESMYLERARERKKDSV